MTDATIGGSLPNVPLPPTITVSTFVAARIKEIQAMRRCISESSGTKMAFQRLPMHMRRRAMSHMVKRLPRRLREIHTNQMKKSGLPPKSKRPTRKHRRRPLNLRSEYARRQRRIKWLDTHIWHAKRFHMIEKWGYKLPKRPCDKSFKACYRATTQHCLVQDLSYERCIEITGSYDNIMLQLKKISDCKSGLTFGAKCFYEGKKFGELTVFEPNGAKKAIGQLQFFWNYKVNDEKRILWLFVHPAYYKQLLDILILLYELELPKIGEANERIPSYHGSKGVVLRELEYELGKFRLTGPLSTAVLKNALRLVDSQNKPESPANWFHNHHCVEALLAQNQVFNNLMATGYFPPNMVLAINVYDPRMNLPKKRTKALISPPSDYGCLDDLQKNASLSPLFEDSVRKFVRNNKVSNAEICNLRSSSLIPGLEPSLGNEAIVPIILLWRPGNKTEENNGYASGWEVIVPSSWSQTFFLSFVMWGARAGGLKETESIAFERSQTDILYPDSSAGALEEQSVTDVYRETFFRLPPNKRTNYNKFGIVSPFSFNWQMLVSDWSGTKCDSVLVLRDKGILKNLHEFFTSKKGKSSVLPPLPANCLVPVKVTPITKGLCRRSSIICVPIQGDIKQAPVEPKRKDLLLAKRSKLRKEHKNLIKRLRRRRKRAVMNGKPTTATRTQADEDLLGNYHKIMRDLWLPEPNTIRASCSRQIMGFIKHGDFSFTLGQAKGLGYVVADSLTALATSPQKNKVLIRNPNSRQYKVAVLNVVVE